MASKLILLVALVCAVQVAQGDFLNKTVTDIQSGLAKAKQQVESGIAQGESVLQNLKAKAQEVVQDAIASVKKVEQGISDWVKGEVTKAVQLGKNVTTCVSDEKDNAANIVKQTGSGVEACANATAQPLEQVVADMKNLGGQIGQVMQQVPGQASACVSSGWLQAPQCLASLSLSVLSQTNMYVFAIRDDTVQLTSLGARAVPQVVACGSQGLQAAGTQFAALKNTIVSCIQNGPQ